MVSYSRMAIGTVWLVALMLSATTLAYAYNWGIGPPGPNFNYHVASPGVFTLAQEDEIEEGAAAWNAGEGQVVRGADVVVSRDSDRCAACTGLGNGHDEVYFQTAAWLASHNAAGALAATVPGVLPLPDTDIIFNSGVTWCTSAPSVCGSDTNVSVAQVMMHEFGHRIGFNGTGALQGHENDYPATMNATYPNGGDLGGRIRIHEDDYSGLVDHKADSSTGTNLMLSKFLEDSPGHVFEVWTTVSTFDLSDGAWLTEPASVLAITEHTGGGTVTAQIQWRLSNDDTCFDGLGTEYTIGVKNVSLGVNTPFIVPNPVWNFAGVPAGTYDMCLKIDALNAVTESSEADNKVRSDAQFTVRL